MNAPSTDILDESTLVQRRIRHVTAIHIRNLTPFPARDTFASALTQPAVQSQFTSHGHLSDDMDVTLSQMRSRRISNNSINTHRSLRSDDSTIREEGPSGGRKTSTQRASRSSEGGGHGRQYPTSISAPAIRSQSRTASVTSSTGSRTSGPLLSASTPSSLISGVGVPLSSTLPDNSQTGLENVINSRLVETFLTVTVPRPSSHSPQNLTSQTASPYIPAASRDKSLAARGSKQTEGSTARNTIKPSSLSPADRATTKVRRDSSIQNLPLRSTPSHFKSVSSSTIRSNGNSKRTPQAASPPLSVPDYFSYIHRPSTQPCFFIDIDANHEAGWVDTSGHIMKVEIWGRVGSNLQAEKGKEKEIETNEDHYDVQWKVLDSWDVDLRTLIPLSEDFLNHSSQIPSNSLFITLSPLGETFYLPPRVSFPKRSLSPSVGYTSDPESDVRRVKNSGETVTSSQSNLVALSRRRYRGGTGGVSHSHEDTSKTPGWQDIFKLVTLQNCILDTEGSLSDVVRGIDEVFEGDITFRRRREVSELQARVEVLRASYREVVNESNKRMDEIKTRSEVLRQRKEILTLAREQLQKEVNSEFDSEKEIAKNRAQHLVLCARINPIRTTLLTILSTIFPIELLSPPDLLYTILDVPLPIPLSSSDPAPPLMLPAQKDVTEDGVATSLGYVAQVIHLLAAYSGKALVYPVTCVGSRSLIRDGISMMVGPRMFPLFSKGVDTYRFEYGVFLLNKNIELLMADRELRALDMRHTLPNLKNLLLTLTDGECIHIQQSHPRPLDSPISPASNFEEEEPQPDSSTTPKASDALNIAKDGTTPPASGSTTPTVDGSKKPRPFLAFAPLTDFLRGRYPSSNRISAEEPEEQAVLTTSNSEQSIVSDEREDEENVPGIQGLDVREGGNSSEEKLNGGDYSSAHPSSNSPLPIK